MVNPRNCPRWDRCSAPLCPLHSDWRRTKMLPNEPVCLYLRELAKPGGRDTLDRFPPREMVDRITEVTPAMIATAGPLRRALRRASLSGSNLQNFLNRRLASACPDTEGKA